jgi:hypothetical protein
MSVNRAGTKELWFGTNVSDYLKKFNCFPFFIVKFSKIEKFGYLFIDRGSLTRIFRTKYYVTSENQKIGMLIRLIHKI